MMSQLSDSRRFGNDRPRLGRRSSIPAHAAAVLCFLIVNAGVLQAQDSTKAKTDSLAARLERAEEAIRLLQEQLAAEAQSSVKTRSRVALEFNGRVLVNAFSNSRRVNNVDDPIFVRPDTANGLPQGGAGMAIRQTELGFSISADQVFGGKFHGDLDIDFSGGQQPSSGGRTFPLIRMRVARAQVVWKHGELLLGQEAPLISGLNPVSLAAISTPMFTAAGNLWIWLPQLRAGLETGGTVSLGIQGAILAPNSADPQGLFSTDNDIAERSKRPFLEGRVHVKWGNDEMAGDVGVGVHRGWFATKGDSLLVNEAIAVDALIPLARWLELRGEGYDGKGMKVLGGGAIGQGFGVSGAPLRSTGAWGQVNIKPTMRVTIGGGYGFDEPRKADLPAGAMFKNSALEAHVHVRPGGPLVVGFEYRRLETTYAAGKLANDHLNLAFGFEF